MAISYPLSTPTNIGIANITLMAENAVAISQSPFTFQQQIIAHPGQRWSASISLPPMRRVDAENWVAFLLSLKGQVGTFLLGDPNCFDAQGSATELRNLILRTEEFDNAYWTQNGVTITANATTSPNATVTADQAVEGLTTTHQVSFATGVTAGSTYTFSVYIKPNGRPRARIVTTATSLGTQVAIFDVTAGTFVSGSGSISNAGNGWYRCSQTFTATATESVTYRFRPDNGTTDGYTGDGASGFFLWGAQLEVGPTPTAYQGVVDAYGPFVNGAGQTGDTLLIDGCSPNVSTFFKAGDYIQLGSGSATNLYKVLTDTSTNDAGQATLDLWPNLRSSPGDDDPVVVANTKGRFRLKDNITQWNINEISSYGITFDCVEAI
jgi:hypothetical protein